MNALIRQIRARLRLSMNGIASASMREKGVIYKLNFGVSLPRLKEIAREYAPDRNLAESMWAEDVRELKILATMLYPPALFTFEQAEKWAAQVQHIEIAEQLSFNLLQHLPFARQLARQWVGKEGYPQFIACHLYLRLFRKGVRLPSEESATLIHHTRHTIENASVPFQRIALSTLIRYGQQSKEQAETILHAFDDYKQANDTNKNEFYETLTFELTDYN